MRPRRPSPLWLFGLALTIVVTSSPLRADQTDDRLPELFQGLAKTPSPIAAAQFEAKIWNIWVEHDDSEVMRFMAIGIQSMGQGNLRVAFNAFDHIIGMAPDFAEGWNKRATVHYMLGQYDASMRDIERTLALEPRHFGALSGMGLIFDAIGNPKAAADAWERALAVHPHIKGARDRIEQLRSQEKGRPI